MVPDVEVFSKSSYYLSNRGVVREDKETIKLKIVFDASYASE